MSFRGRRGLERFRYCGMQQICTAVCHSNSRIEGDRRLALCIPISTPSYERILDPNLRYCSDCFNPPGALGGKGKSNGWIAETVLAELSGERGTLSN